MKTKQRNVEIDVNTYLTNPEKHLKENYGKTSSIVSFMSPRKIYKFYEGRLKMKTILQFLSSSESYTLMKQERPRTVFNPTLTYGYRDLVQGSVSCSFRVFYINVFT